MNRHHYPATVTAASEMPHMPHVGPVFDPKRFVALRGRMMLLVALCAAIPTVTAAWFLVPAGYTASAQIQIKSTEPYVLNADTAATPYAQFVSTEISKITSGAVLEKVLDSEAISSIPTLARLESDSDRLEYLKGAISARARQGNEFVDVTCSMPEKGDALQILDVVIDVYLNHVSRESATAGSNRLDMLTKAREDWQFQLNEQLQTIREKRKGLGVHMVGETPLQTGEAEQYWRKYSEAKENLDAAKNGLNRVKMDIENLNAMIDAAAYNQPIYEFQIEERVATDARVRTLRESIATMEADLSSTADRVKKPLPQRSMDLAKVNSLKEKLTTVEPEVRKELLLSALAQFTQEQIHFEENVKQAGEDFETFGDEKDKYEERLSDASDQYAELEDLESKAAETRRIFEEVNSNIETIKIELGAPARVTPASGATVPGGGPDYMNRFMAMAMAFAASVGLALGLGVWRELADQQVRSSQDLARLTSLPIIASVPHAQVDELPQPFDLTHIISERPLCAISDAYRHVLARLLYSYAKNGGMKSLAVVSASRGDGKSSLTTNLGIALAQAERSVLLIDASYRRPTLETSLGLQRAVGLVEVLEEQVALKQAIRFTSVHGLFVLGPGLDCERLAGTLASRRIAVLLEYAAEKFDYVIVDTPPWLIMSDPKLITPLVDGVIMVVGTASTTLGMVRRCLRELDEVKANVLGLVLNGVRPTFGGYMQKNKELYYGYAHELPTKDDKAVAVALDVPDHNPGASDTDE